MKLFLGQIVIAKTHPGANNGADEAPAVVTRIWNMTDDCCMANLSVFADVSGRMDPMSSVNVHPTREAAEASGETRFAWAMQIV